MARSLQSGRDVGNLGEISPNLARCKKYRGDLAEIQKLTNIMARSRQSRRDLAKLGEISVIFFFAQYYCSDWYLQTYMY